MGPGGELKDDVETSDPKNPFVHHLHIPPLQKLKMTILGLTIMPLRLMVAFVCLTFTAVLANISLLNLSPQQIDEKPLTGWRLQCRKIICGVLRVMFFICGFHRIKIVGKQATADQARILVVAPHSTFFDALAVCVMGAPSVVGKAEIIRIPFWGSLVNCTQPVLVHRSDPNSRQNTIRQIVGRSDPSKDWQQVLIFPEGTCTNRTSFITFRPGAFLPGVPVQPVLLGYNNELDTVTWTWEGLPAWKVLLFTLSQFTVNLTIEFLEPYVPSKEETENAHLFARNLRSVMAQRLGISTSDCSYFDYLRIEKSKNRGKALLKLQRKLEEPLLQTTAYIDGLGEESLQSSKHQLYSKIGASEDLPELKTVFDDMQSEDQFDLRHLRVSVLISASSDSLQCFLLQSFNMFDDKLGPEKMSKSLCLQLLKTHIFLSTKEAQEAVDYMSEGDFVEKVHLEAYITEKKPNYVKVLKALEDQLNSKMTDMFAKSASLTAELMAARLEKVAASGSSLMSATVAAGREKVTDAFSSAVTSLHKRTDSYTDKKKE